MDIKKFQLQYLNSNMFMLIENRNAILIDPIISEEAYKILKEKSINQVLIILTHSHFDHTSGTVWFSDRFNSKIIAHKDCASLISKKKNNRPLLMCMVLQDLDKKSKGNRLKNFLNNFKPYTITTDILIESVYKLTWENHVVLIKHTPGHSKGSICILIDNCVFTGDYLIKGAAVNIPKFSGSEADFIDITVPILSGIELGTMVYPGHGNVYQMSASDIDNLLLFSKKRR